MADSRAGVRGGYVGVKAAILLGGAAVTLLAVQIATAQGPARDPGIVGPPLMITQIVRAGVTPAGDGHVTRGTSKIDGGPAKPSAQVSVPRRSTQPGQVAGLTINPMFDSTITSDPNAGAIVNTILAAIANVESQFTDPITVTITFKKDLSISLGQSLVAYYNLPYATFINALRADAKTVDDLNAIALLPSASTNPVNDSSTINVKAANLKAVGFVVNSTLDGTISVNTSITSPGSSGSTLQYSLLNVVAHEIDEVLGLGSSLPTEPQTTIFPQDLFRYDQLGARTFTTVSNALAFFSINASTVLAQFDNQNDGGDFGDWQSNPLPFGVSPKVQDAFATPFSGDLPLTVELTALDVIGYDRVASGVAPSITLQPVNRLVRPGLNASFTVAASGMPAPTFQWQISTDAGSVWSNLLNGAPYSGVTTTTLTITGASLSLSGNQYRAIAINAIGSVASSAATLTVRLSAAPGDFDGDGKSDVTIFRPSNDTWYVLRSSTNFSTYGTYVWGVAGDLPLRGDFDGDGKADVAIYRPSTGAWYILQSSTNYTTYLSYTWGLLGDIPEPADYDGDGKTDIAVYRPSTGAWYVLLSSTGYTTYVSQVWGLAGDMPVPEDYDGDGKIDLAVYRPSNSGWYILLSSTNYSTYLNYSWGVGGDTPVPADFDGDGKSDIVVYRPSTGAWYVLKSSTNYTAFDTHVWGVTGDQPVLGDFDGDGKIDIAVYRPSNGTWYILLSSTNYTTYVSYVWGLGGDVPLLKRP
jgi:FG-GAP-like repeat